MNEITQKYEIILTTSKKDAEIDLYQARLFIDEVKAYLRREKWL